ncbi:hypothetical protein ARAM_003486 [Aspergillus rambellii]|uniref:Subtelomeric hrmA-associated cluster protein AFUB-079030/YDR124W-like helical bundle domain-containing protein n=1 Tax=Aspergillus rambellii TaxID=308745 RepID=A0A0F8UIL8_9EURO|nr:hypothetical protein ARAM_003486 [Aspergillus rambellii]
MSHTPISMDAPLDSLAYLHFALLYIDETGKLRFEASPSIANNCQTILSPDVTDSFLRAVALSNKGDTTKLLESSEGKFEDSRGRSPLSPESPDAPGISRRGSIFQHTDSQQSKRKRVSHECVVPMSITCHPKTMLPIRNQSLLRRYYEKAFESLQQINCRILAKAYIKLVEPRKQVNYPYNGRKIISGSSQQFDPEMTKPAWWPTGVTHREPDHLLKAERIRLLVHILCELRESHAICVEKLKEADQSIRRQISPVERLQVLDEIYRVREEEESYLDGRTDGQAVVCISRVHLPDMTDAQASLCSPTGSMLRSDSMYRKEIPDLESHTSVFPSSGSSPTSDIHTTRKAHPSQSPSAAAWDACAPANALPPINSVSKRPTPDTATPYTLDLTTSALFPHQEPSTPLDGQSFTLKYYTDPHLTAHHPHHLHQPGVQGHSQSQASMPVMGLSGADLGCTNPYYFNY